MKLYMTESSGNAYKPRLLLEMLKVPYEKVTVDTKNKEHKQPPFLKINPRGQVPALEDDGRMQCASTPRCRRPCSYAIGVAPGVVTAGVAWSLRTWAGATKTSNWNASPSKRPRATRS